MANTDPVPSAAQALLRTLTDEHKINISCVCDASYGPDDETAALKIDRNAEGFSAFIRCSGEKSMFYALREIERRVLTRTLEPGAYPVAPSFAVRGYIEGFYGKPWTQEQRLSVMALAAKYRMNTVFYAPKDDPYHRDRWKEPYPEESLTQLKALSDRAGALYMDFYFCVAPGLSIRYSDASDFDALCHKAKQVFDLGVRCFGLLLDDIDDSLTDETDKQSYGDLADAHIDLVNRFYAYLTGLSRGCRLVVCPTVYHGTGNEPYITKLGKGIREAVGLFRTGPDICSRALTSADAALFAARTGHKPLYWDNYPVNDEAMFREMHLGPVIGRDGDLGDWAQGLIANCMEYAECTKIPLCTVADYLWDSEHYDPEHSFYSAAQEAVGEENVLPFLCFADHLYTSCLLNTNDRRLTEAFSSVGKLRSEGRRELAATLAYEYLEQMEESLAFLSRELPLCRELQPWIKKYRLACRIIKKLFDYLLCDDRDALREEILSLIDVYVTDPTVLIHEFVFREVLMDRYF